MIHVPFDISFCEMVKTQVQLSIQDGWEESTLVLDYLVFKKTSTSRAFASCLEDPGFNSRPSETKNFKLVD